MAFSRPAVVVSQDRMRVAAEYQALAWQANDIALSEIQAIAIDLKHGATVETGPLVYDAELKMARTRRVG